MFKSVLQTAGAAIAHKPSEAQVILVDSTTDAGRQFIRDWGNDKTKVVLEYYWANRSLDAGKPLLENDDFGGCRTYDDGRPIGGDQSETHKSVNLYNSNVGCVDSFKEARYQHLVLLH
jgi:hypothetical protein